MRDATHAPDYAARKIAAAFSGSQVTLAELDADLHYTAIYNPGILIGSREALGRRVVEAHGAEGGLLADLARRALLSGAQQVASLRIDADGRTRHLELRVTPIDDGGGPARLALLATEAPTPPTAIAEIEAQMVERERFVATGRLAATVAHEVNTPLQAIESCLHLAGRVDDLAERTRYLRLAREEIKRVGFTMRQLLDLYRPAATQAPLDVNGLIERVLLLIGNSLSRRSIQIERDLSADLPVVVGRADEMTQVLINLVFNAMQAMPQGGVLRLESGRALNGDGVACLTVRVHDTGDGIDPAVREQIFEPFFTTRTDGTGLGLAICRQIIEGYGGALRVESSPSFGSSFTIEIPTT